MPESPVHGLQGLQPPHGLQGLQGLQAPHGLQVPQGLQGLHAPHDFARHGLHGLHGLQAPHLAATRITAFGKAVRLAVSCLPDFPDIAAAVELSNVNGVNAMANGSITEPKRPAFLFFIIIPIFTVPKT